MNYINRPKECYTQEEWIRYLEESIRELRKEKENLKKDKGEIRQRLVKLEKAQSELSRVKENKELREENKKLKERVSELEDVSEDYDLLSKDFIALGEENEKLKKERDLYKARNEELNENCFGLSKENDKLKSDLSECECSMHFENDEVGYRKRECKKLKEKVRFLEECLDNKEKVNKSLREELSAYDREYFDEDKKAENIFIDKSGKVIKGGEFTTLC